jgi:hypothetical protein
MMARRTCFAVLMLAAAFSGLLAPTALAQSDFAGTSYITPYPEGDTHRLQVYGDAFAEGLLSGLVEAFVGDTRLQVQRKNRSLPGLIRPDLEDELRAEEASRDPVHIAVVMVGVNDRYNIRISPRDRFVVGTDEWREEYGRRVDRVIKTLKKRGAAIYWVGQPIMRSREANEPAQVMNDIVREKAYLNNVKYIDITAHFADEAGNYTPYGPDVSGTQRLVRSADGLLFTWAGYRKLAHFVEREIKRDLAQARNDRSVPLAGSEAEQKRIAAQRPQRDPAAEWKGTVTTAKETRASPKGEDGPAQAPSLFDAQGEQKADNGRISLKTINPGGREETVTLDLPRPAIPAAVIQLITRKDTGERPSQMGDAIADDIGGGLVVLSSVTPALSGPGSARRVSPGQPYYQVWIKGERQPPKPGRADDFTWPREDPVVEVPEQRAPKAVPRPPPRS